MEEPSASREASLGALLARHAEDLVHRWYDGCRHDPGWCELDEDELKDTLPLQIRLLGEAMQPGTGRAPPPRELWRRSDERLQAEDRVLQHIPIEQVVRGYGLFTATILAWLEEQGLRPSLPELAYFCEAMHELAAEAVRRYVAFQSELVRRERGEYLAGVAHQMRGPLSVLTMGLATLRSAVPPDVARLLSSMDRSVRHLTAQSADVMRLERYTEHDVPVHPDRLDVAQLLDDVVLDVRGHAEGKNLALETHVAPGLQIEADPVLLIDALGNLVQNAVKYTEGGRVTVTAAREATGRVCFRVSDTGPGIEPERQAQLFKPTHPTKPGGVGIGLAVAHRAVKAQSGDIGVESVPGHGSCFWFTLPAVVEPRG
jgi:two-component system, OmpR family, sensor histidine kinase SenX3